MTSDWHEWEGRDLLPWTKRTLPEHLLLCMHDAEDASKVVARTPREGLWVSVAEVEIGGEAELSGQFKEASVEFDLDIGMRVDVLRAETGESWHAIARLLRFETNDPRPEVVLELGALAEPALADDLREFLQRGQGAELLWGALARWREDAARRWVQADASCTPPPPRALHPAAASGSRSAGDAGSPGGAARGTEAPERPQPPWAAYPFLPSCPGGVGGPAAGWLQPAALPAWLPPQPGLEAVLRPRPKPQPAKIGPAPKSSSAAIKACAGGCGFAATWHPTHCCNFCLVKRGHGGRCERVPVAAEEPAAKEEAVQEAPAPLLPDAAHTMWALRGPLGDGADAREPALAERAAELQEAILKRDFARAFGRLDEEAAEWPAAGSGRRALHACAEAGSLDLLQMVLAARADVNAKDASGRSALALAAARGRAELCGALLEAGAAAAEAGAGLEAEPPAEGRPSRGREEVSSLIDERERPQKYGRVLLRAIAQKDARTALSALEAGADANFAEERGDKPLLLLAKGKWRGREAQQAQLAQRLVVAGSEVECRSSQGSGALHFAAHRGSLALVEALLELRADVGAANDEGSTPLMYAAHGGHSEVCTALMEAFAPCGARNKHGFTAERMANRQGFRRCAVLIQAYEMAPKRPGEDERPQKAPMQERPEDVDSWSALEKVLKEEEEEAGAVNDKFKQAMAMMRGETLGFGQGQQGAGRERRIAPSDYGRWERIVDDLERKEELRERQERLEHQPEFVWCNGVKMRLMV